MPTNYERAMKEFLASVTENCTLDHCLCYSCKLARYCDKKNLSGEWLQEECDANAR